jgi:predicted MFS family arabinose efflux permease
MNYPMNRKMTFLMAAAAGAAVANIYFNQPMLAMIQKELPGRMTGIVPTATQIGYTLGLLFLVPLGDVLDRKRLIVAQFALLAAALAGTAMAPSGWALAFASVAIGIAASVAQQIIPLAAHLAPSHRRGSVVGSVMAGLLCGILLSRTIAGFVALHGGWREMFWIGVPVALLASLGMAVHLPSTPPSTQTPYRELLRSLLNLYSEHKALRVSVITQGLLFASFSVFWTVLAYHLQEPRFGFGSDIVGLFGIVGAVGVLAAPIAGKVADKRGPRPVIIFGAALSIVAWIVFGVWNSVAGLIAGIILLDFGIQSALVAHQTIVFAIQPEARGRLNTIFMSGMFLGGALGSAAAIQAWSLGGWLAVTSLGAILGTLAGILALLAGSLTGRIINAK